VAGDVDQITLVEFLAPAQPGPSHATSVEIVGAGSLDDFRPPSHRFLANPRTEADAVCVDRRTRLVVTAPA
jgi:hypothetical protein